MRRATSFNTKLANGLEAPLPVCHHHHATHVVYAHRPDSLEQSCAIPFTADYAAALFVQAIVGSDEVEEVAHISGLPAVMTSSGVLVRCVQLPALLEREQSDLERQSIPGDYMKMARGLRYRVVPKLEEPTDEEGQPLPKLKKEPKLKVDRTGKVSIQDIAAQIEMTPKEARGILRKLKTPKPEGGWLFDAGEVDALKKKLLENRK